MAVLTKGLISQEVWNNHIEAAAAAAEYEDGFGIEGCDLSSTHWWAIYQRQSEEEQCYNNRLPDYLRTCALEAKRLSVVVPREYILYDAVTGEHLERPDMIRLRRFIAERRIAGVIFPTLDRLSREPLHQQIFELEAAHHGVRLHYADAPSGNDPGSQFARTILAHAAKLVKIANRTNNRAGNIGRVVNKNVPAGKTSYGYEYLANYEDLGHGQRRLISAWWQINRMDAEGNLEWGSEAWVVAQVFHWIGNEGRTLYWVARELNKLGIKPRYAEEWSPALISHMVKNRCYTGNHAYNKATYVPNPERPLGDITGEIRRTIRQRKPESEWVSFEIPCLVSEELWQQANRNLQERGRGRGKEGKRIEALFRGRVFCPSCGQLLGLYRDTNYRHLTYYVCKTRSQGWKQKRCHIHAPRVDWLDNVGWDCVRSLVSQPGLIEEQLRRQDAEEKVAELTRRMQLEQRKKDQAQAKIQRVQEGYESDPPVYTAKEADERIRAYRDTILRVEAELQRLQGLTEQQTVAKETAEAARQALEALRDTKLDKATFAEKRDLIAKLGIKVYPSEDGKVVRIVFNVHPFNGSATFSPQKISIASPKL
jgi:site-specific DNA recombinase